MQLNYSMTEKAPRRGGLFRRILDDRSANALIEFAFSLPIFMVLGMYGTELAYMATVNMQVSQISMALADNASRLGQTDNSAVSPTINNSDIDSIMDGAMRQGASIQFQQNGRLILSSLERHPILQRQYVHWQKCRGNLSQASVYGGAGHGLIGQTIQGLGKPGKIIAAEPNSAVMFVEAFYTYKPLFGEMFVKNIKFSQEAAFIVRDDRDLTGGVPLLPTGNSECAPVPVI